MSRGASEPHPEAHPHPGNRFPRRDYEGLASYDPGRTPVAVDLSDNTNLWGPHPAALEAVLQSGPEALTRYPSVYAQELRAAVALRFGVPGDCVVTGCGSDDILDSAFRAAAFPPGKVVFPSPTFSMAERFARMNGLKSVSVPWKRAETDPGRLLLEEPDLVYLCRPNNPTGASLSRDWLVTLLALGGADGPLVVLDEAYADFARDSFLNDAPGTSRLLVVRTFSKLFGMAGLRVGFAVGSPTVAREVEKSRGPYKVSQIAHAAALAALEDESYWEETVVRETVENRQRLIEALRTRGLHPLPSETNFVLVPVEPASAVQVNRALVERGVSCRPFSDLLEIGDALRITVGPWDLMERFLAALDELLAGDPDTSGSEAEGKEAGQGAGTT